MLPAYHSGDLVYARCADNYQVGDVIVFNPPQLDARVIHRVTDLDTPSGFVTKGDNNASPDPWILSEREIAGVEVVRAPRVGGLLANSIFWASLLLIGVSMMLRTRRTEAA